MCHILYQLTYIKIQDLHWKQIPVRVTSQIPVITVKKNRSTRVKWRDISRGQPEETQVFKHKQVRWECNLCKSAFAAKETLKGKNSKNAQKLRFSVQYVEMFNEQEISTNTSWWSMRKMTRDVTRHIKADEHCDICEKIALLWKISTTKRSK